MKEKELNQLRDHYEWSMEKAKEWGLTPFSIDFHVVPAEKLYEIASYGIPGHFSHWTYGRDFWRQKASYDHGHSKIYELVINSNPAQAFLMETNSTFENQFTISHVVGHSHFFANNAYFTDTGKRFDQSVVVFADRIHEFEMQHGRYVVEDFIDQVFTISHHVEPNPHIKKVDKEYEYSEESDVFEDLFPEVAEAKEARQLEWENTVRHRGLPIEPTEDVLGWIAQYATYLDDWQREICWMIREESIYFRPQLRTKIMNEGFASLIHRCLLHDADLEDDIGGISFATLHSSVFNTRAGALNPYTLGYNIFWDVIQEFGEHTDDEMDNFDFINGEGWEKALEIVEIDSDASFISNYLTEKVCEKMDLFEYGYDPKEQHWLILEKDWEKVRNTLVDSLMDSSIPQIAVAQGAPGYGLRLKNLSSKPLNDKFAKNTLIALQKLWVADVTLESVEDGELVEYAPDRDESGKIVKKKI